MSDVIGIIENYFSLRYVGDLEDIRANVAELTEEQSHSLIKDFETHFFATPLSDRKYAYIADARLSGLPVYCGANSCRENYLYDLSSFAALYADRTYVTNPFSYAETNSATTETEKYRFVDDLTLAISYAINARPLLEKGIIQFAPYDCGNYCFDCASKILGFDDPNNSLSSQILNHLQDTSTAKFIIDETDGPCVLIEYDQSHGEHKLYFNYTGDPSNFRNGELLTKKDISDMCIYNRHIQMTIHDFFTKNVEAKKLGVTNILSNSAEKQIVKSLIGDQQQMLFNSDYPTLFNANLSSLLELRSSNWKHLEKYRDLVVQLKKEKPDDITAVLAELKSKEDDLSRLIARHKENTRNTLIESSILGVFGIGGMFATSGISGLLSGLAGLAGSACFAKDTIPAIRKSFSDPIEAKETPMYYSWKIKKNQ